jgi:hypothetical protein
MVDDLGAWQYAMLCSGVGKKKAADYDHGSCLPSEAYLNLVHDLQKKRVTLYTQEPADDLFSVRTMLWNLMCFMRLY